MSKLETNQVDPATGTTLTLGTSGDTITIPAGVNANLGSTGSTITVPSGSTIVNSGTATGFGGTNSSQFAAYASAGQSFNSGSYTKINIVNEFFDVDSDYDASNSKFVAPSAGKYFLYGQFALVRAGTFTGNPCHLKVRIYKNGSGIDYIGTIFSTTDGSRINIVNISAIVDASASDYFEVYGYHDKGSAETGGGESLFQGFKLIS